MTTTNRLHRLPEPPAWLNLDGYCPPDVREQLANACTLLDALLAPDSEFMQVCRRAYDAGNAYEAATQVADIDSVDDAHLLFGPYTGFDRFLGLVDRLAAAASAASGDLGRGLVGADETAPEWYLPWGERFGLIEPIARDV